MFSDEMGVVQARHLPNVLDLPILYRYILYLSLYPSFWSVTRAAFYTDVSGCEWTKDTSCL